LRPRTFLKRIQLRKRACPREVLEGIAARVAPLGWHIVIYFEIPNLPELEGFFTSLPTTVVVDHMGTPDVKKGVDHPENQRFHRLMEFLGQGDVPGADDGRRSAL
jgi:2-pyrone-4,6-dicarboxylate lactonase